MNKFYMGAYWKVRKLTMREFADATKQFLRELCLLHPVFNGLFYAGSKPNAEVKLSPDFENLDDLIYRNCWDPEMQYENANPDGSPSWDTASIVGFTMIFNNGKAISDGGIHVNISAGMFSPRLNNVVFISFPPPDNPGFPYPEFYRYEFVERLFQLTVNFWDPESALLTERSFGAGVDFEYGSDEYNNYWRVGLLTYLDNSEVSQALPPDIEHYRLKAGGELIITTREIRDANNPGHIANAIRIRDTMKQKGALAKIKYVSSLNRR